MPHTPAHTLLEAVRQGYERASTRGARLLLAVSGGIDSMTLLRATHELSEELALGVEVACVDHGLRSEAAQEADLVERACRAVGWRVHRLKASIHHGPGLEARAREARYQVLERTRLECQAAWLVTAHSASDQAETVLMRLARGASSRGARGILEWRGALLRPMLRCPRSLIAAAADQWSVSYAQDPMNEDPRFFRTRVRANVLPVLEAASPGATLALARYAEHIAQDEALLARLASEAASRLTLGPGALDAVGLRALVPALRRRVLAQLAAQAGAHVDAKTLERMGAALMRGGRVGLSAGRTFAAASGVVRVISPGALPPEKEAELTQGGAPVSFGGLWLRFSTGERPRAQLIAPLPASAGLPLRVRARRPGERVGSQGRRRRLQDVLVDAKVPSELRDQVPVVVDAADRVVWVPGIWTARGEPSESGWLSGEPSDQGQAPVWLVRYKE
jgi:tRNA(Ile)-lysidine synthase